MIQPVGLIGIAQRTKERNGNLRGNIPYSETSSAGRDNPVDVGAMRPFDNLVLDRIGLVWHNRGPILDHLVPVASYKFLDDRSGLVRKRIEVCTVADCDRESDKDNQEDNHIDSAHTG